MRENVGMTTPEKPAPASTCADLLTSLPEGIHAVSRDPSDGSLLLEFDPSRTTEKQLKRYAERMDRLGAERFRTCGLRLSGRFCETCASRLEKRIELLPGVRRAHASFLAGRLSIDYDPSQTSAATLDEGVRASTPEDKSEDASNRLESVLMILCGVSLGLGLLLEHFLPGQKNLALAAWVLAYLSGGWFGVSAGLKSLLQGVVDVDLLMVLAALGAAYVNAPFEGGMLLFLFALSNVLQAHALDRSRKAIQALMKLRPSRVLQQNASGDWAPVAIEDVVPGALVRVKPGENIALDGHVVRGESSVDESSLTGESLPISKAAGDALFAGTMNQSGALEYRVDKRAADSTLARIISLVEDAQAQKAKTQRFLEKAEQHYALGVILLTLGLILVPWLVFGAEFSANFYRAMTVMVVASPCALVISTPAAFLSAIGGAARRGVLFKGGVHLERMADIEVVAFDKTGTLTRGKPRVTHVLCPENGLDADTLLRLTAALEVHSEHPLARAVLESAREKGLKLPEANGFQALPGKGAVAEVEGHPLAVGSLQWFEQSGVILPGNLAGEAARLQEEGRGIIVVGERLPTGALDKVLGLLAVADELRPDAPAIVSALRKLGVRRIAMLTGDHPRVAAHIAKAAGIDDVFAGLLPEDKVGVIRKLARIGPVAMIGDGVNDAPALAAAHVGVAMGAAGTDVAMETADVVLMGENLQQLAYALALSRQSRRIVTQNLVFSLAVILVLVISALTIGIPLPLGVVGHEGSTVLVCLNGLRLLTFRWKGLD